MGDNLVFAVRGSSGFSLVRGLSSDAQKVIFEEKESPKTNPCEVMTFSNNGHLFAYCDTQNTRVIDVATGKVAMSSDLKRTKSIIFSPKDTHMLTYVPYAIYGKKVSDDQKPEPNLRIYNIADGRLVTTLIAPKEATWRPQWCDDESVAVRLVGSELLFHRNNAFDRYDTKISAPGIQCFALSPGSGSHIAYYIASSGSNPARVQVRAVNPEFTLVANKTFFKSDKADLIWNHRGTSLIILTCVEVDAANLSYYGEQQVFLVNTQTDESFMVPLSKNGPVYSVKWNPNGKEFAVCYGYMPSKLTVYNTRGEIVFDVAEGPRNEVHYNAFGNILLACGFGNVARGKMEFWDVEKKKEIISIDVPNTTQFEWAPDGQHFFTATTTPRLRIDNCYRLWHYSGKLITEYLCESPREELWQAMWRPMSSYNKFEVKDLTKAEKMQTGLLIKKKDASHPLNNLPAGAVSKGGAYVPPHLRGKANGASGGKSDNGNAAAPVKPQMNELEKKVFFLNKKLQDITKLKEKQTSGQVLQKNQLDKISGEDQILAELAALKV